MKKLVYSIYFLVFLLVCCAGMHAQCTSTIFVKRNANGTNDGSSWENAHRSIQAALDQAEACATIREIWVAEGVYKPTVDVSGSTTISLTANRTLVIDFNVRMYGGFGGYETSPQQRIKHLFPTIISGDHNDDDVYTTNINSFSFPSTNITDNSYNLIRMKNLNENTIVDGFILEGGNANQSGSTLSKKIGGAIFNDGRGLNNQSNPIISNCIFRFNSAKVGGGAIYNYGENGDASPSFIGCEFKYNYSRDEGGGAIVNFAKNSGGKSSPNFISCLFSSNVASRSTPSAPLPQGGAVLNASINFGKSEPFFKNCTIVKNKAALGGGLSNVWDASILIAGSESIINIENTILDNTSTADMSNPNISNSMTMTNVSYSIVLENSVYPGVGNMNDDPQFVDSINFRLLDSSPAIDAGKPINGGFGGGPVYDIENNARLIGSREDVGAYEFLSCPDNDSIYVNETQYNNSPNGRSISFGLNSLTMALEMAKTCSGTPHILLSEGVYTPHRSKELLPLDGILRRSARFSIEQNIRITGGQVNESIILNQPGPSILTGDYYRNDGPGISGRSDNLYTVIEAKGNIEKLEFENLQVERGENTASGITRAPGLHIDTITTSFLDLKIKSCEFRKHNSIVEELGTIDIDLSRGGYDLNASIINTNIVGNDALDGAALRVFNQNSSSKLLLDTCVIQGNDSHHLGSNGPLTYISNSTYDDEILIRNGNIQENDGASQGGTMYFAFNNNSSGSVKVENCFIQDNEASFGGAIYYQGSTMSELIIKRSAVYSNSAYITGGALYMDGGPTYIDNSIFRRNKIEQGGSSGGAIDIDKGGVLTSNNNSFIDNEAQVSGGAIWSNSANTNATITNTIFWNNEANGSINTLDFSSIPNEPFALNYSLIEEDACPINLTCNDVIYNEDPLIEGNIGSLNYTPGSGSPAINAGDRTALPNEFTDYTGMNYRVVGYEIDIGAFEVPQTCIDNLALAPIFPMRNLVGGWYSSNKMTVIGPQSTKPNGWLILNSPTVEFNGEYEFDSGETLEIYSDGCINN